MCGSERDFFCILNQFNYKTILLDSHHGSRLRFFGSSGQLLRFAVRFYVWLILTLFLSRMLFVVYCYIVVIVTCV